MSPIIQLKQLSKHYKDQCVVNGIDLAVSPGVLFGILGTNGAGKTTLMRMIQGVTPPDAGQLQVMGYAIPEQAVAMRHRLGVVPQTDNLDPDFSVFENLQVYGSYFDMEARRLQENIDELLDFVELQDYADAHISTLSGGMKRRLTFARALINDPDLIILDEPTTGLDAQIRHQLWDKLKILRQQGKTLILTTHYLEEAQRLCDELVIMDSGCILQQGSPGQLIASLVESEVVEIHDHPQAIAILQQIAGCRIERSGGAIYGYVDDAGQAIGQLHEAGIAALQRPTNLEDVFLQLTGRSLRH